MNKLRVQRFGNFLGHLGFTVLVIAQINNSAGWIVYVITIATIIAGFGLYVFSD